MHKMAPAEGDLNSAVAWPKRQGRQTRLSRLDQSAPFGTAGTDSECPPTLIVKEDEALPETADAGWSNRSSGSGSSPECGPDVGRRRMAVVQGLSQTEGAE